MRFSHLVLKGSNYHFVCRVPVDLRAHFPTATLWRSLKTSDKKSAKVLAAVVEQRTQQVFLQLRSGMLTPEMEKQIVDAYLCHNTRRLECQATGEEYTPIKATLSPVDDVIHQMMEGWAYWQFSQEREAKQTSTPLETLRERQIELLDVEIASRKRELMCKSPHRFSGGGFSERVSNSLKQQKLAGLSRGLTDTEQTRLGLKVAAVQAEVDNAERAILGGDWSLLQQLQKRTEDAIHTSYAAFDDIAKKYEKHYKANSPHVRPGTLADVEVECRTLTELVGKRSIAEANSLDMVAEIKTALHKYPKNRLQRFGDKSIQTIFKTERGYETISPKTANQYIARMTAIIDYAIENRTLSTANVWLGKRFKITTLAEEERLPYDKQDIERLIDALCTKPLWRYNPPKPDRFWVVMIALLQGFRLGNITGLHKKHIVAADGIPCFDLAAFGSKGVKRAATAQLVPVHPMLAELGFLKWVDKLDRDKLFQDSADQLSKWYNRNDHHGLGFEPAYVTKDPLKCLYSTRHVFAGDIYSSTGDMKLVKDSLGHASDKRNVTSRYTGRAKIEAILSAMESMKLEGLDVPRLKQRAAELFGL